MGLYYTTHPLLLLNRHCCMRQPEMNEKNKEVLLG